MSRVDAEYLVALGQRVVAQARSAEQVEVVIAHSVDTEVRAYDGAVESLVSAESAGAGIRVVRDGRQGFAAAGTLDESALMAALADARDNATFATPDPHVGLASPDGVPQSDVELFDGRLLAVDTATKIDLALALEAATTAADARVVGMEAADYSDSVATTAIVSTEGISAFAVETVCSLISSSIAAQGDDVSTGFGFSIGRSVEDLSVDRAAHDSVRRAVRMLGARRTPTGRSAVVLEPWVTAQLLGIVAECFSAEAVLKGRSPFADRLGHDVAARCVTLVDDPTEARAFGATAVDGEGLATRRTDLISDGTATAWLHDSLTARRMAAVSTGSAVRGGFRSTPAPGPQAVRLVGGHGTAEDLCRLVGDGVLVSDVSGLHSGVNPVSGDFSAGIEGVRIRNGEPAEPIREVTIASSLQRMLGEVIAVADDTEWCPLEAAGCTVAIGDVTVSGE